MPDEMRPCVANMAKHLELSEHEFIMRAIADKLDPYSCMLSLFGHVDAAQAVGELPEFRRSSFAGEFNTSDLIAERRR